MRFPAAIIFVNNDLTDQVKSVLQSQLFISDTMSGEEFDARVAADPNYVNIVHNTFQRILVIRTFWNQTNRDLCDIAMFFKNGLLAVETNKYGPPGGTYSAANINIYQLLSAPGAPTFSRQTCGTYR
jgi:hypothetical protein